MKNYIYTERTHLFEPNVYINFIARIEGNPPIDILLSAIHSAFKANEATMSKIVMKDDSRAYYEKIRESSCCVTVINKDFEEIIRENEKIPFNINQGQLMKVFIIPNNKDVLLVIIAHHLLGDGKSITYFLEDVMKALSGIKLIYKPLKLITPESFIKDITFPWGLKLYINKYNNQWYKTKEKFAWSNYYDIHKLYWENYCSQIIYETFTEKELQKILLYTREKKITLNSYLMTAFLEADRKTSTIGIAVDARIDNNRSLSNQVTGISVNYKYSDKLSFTQNAKALHNKVYKKLNKPSLKYFILKFISLFTPGLIDAVLLNSHDLYKNKYIHKLAKNMGYKENKKAKLGITNLTKLDIPSCYSNYKIKDVLFIPPVVSYSEHVIGVSTINNRMTISFHFMDNKNYLTEENFFKKAIINIRDKCI